MNVKSAFVRFDENELMADTELEPPFEAYRGDEPFIFVSYAHKDAASVFPELQTLRDAGYRIWFDEGIDPGNEWPDQIARALKRASMFLVFISPAAVASRNVRNSGDTWTNTLGMKFACIPAGEFDMGSPETEAGREDNETLHRVKITKPFMMAITIVTQSQWKALMGGNPSHSKGDDLPVEQVNWDDAVLFCKEISEKEGKSYRLPTEAEWEYACVAMHRQSGRKMKLKT